MGLWFPLLRVWFPLWFRLRSFPFSFLFRFLRVSFSVWFFGSFVRVAVFLSAAPSRKTFSFPWRKLCSLGHFGLGLLVSFPSGLVSSLVLFLWFVSFPSGLVSSFGWFLLVSTSVVSFSFTCSSLLSFSVFFFWWFGFWFFPFILVL